MEKLEKENENIRSIKVHPDLIKILEKLREKHAQLTYGVAKLSYFEATGILAKKIGNRI